MRKLDEMNLKLTFMQFCQLVGSTKYLFSLPIPYGKEDMKVQSETLESDEHEVNPWFYYSLVVWHRASPTLSQLNPLFIKGDYGSYPIRQNISIYNTHTNHLGILLILSIADLESIDPGSSLKEQLPGETTKEIQIL